MLAARCFRKSTIERATPGRHEWEHEAVFEALEFTGLDLPARDAESVEASGCRFRGTDLSGSAPASAAATC